MVLACTVAAARERAMSLVERLNIVAMIWGWGACVRRGEMMRRMKGKWDGVKWDGVKLEVKVESTSSPTYIAYLDLCSARDDRCEVKRDREHASCKPTTSSQ